MLAPPTITVCLTGPLPDASPIWGGTVGATAGVGLGAGEGVSSTQPAKGIAATHTASASFCVRCERCACHNVWFLSPLCVGFRRLVRGVVGSFRRQAKFPSQGGALPGALPGVGWSDHWSFWQVGYPALMVTDTAPFRYPHYHRPSDTPDKLDYERMARVVDGLRAVVEELAE